MKYNKPPLTFREQIELLESRGLVIDTHEGAISFIARVSYYRLESYFKYFQYSPNAYSNIKFSQIVELYRFDCALRNLFFGVLENIEVSLRSDIAHLLAQKYDAFGYLEPKNFSNAFNHKEWMNILSDNIKRSHETFIKEYFQKHDEETYLPIWMAVEVISMGQLSKLYKGLARQDRQEIAVNSYDVNDVVLQSWIHVLVYVRNTCAHHSRLWNRTLAIKPKIPKSASLWEEINNSKYLVFFLL